MTNPILPLLSMEDEDGDDAIVGDVKGNLVNRVAAKGEELLASLATSVNDGLHT